MTEINLLPWRETKREQEKKRFTVYLFLGIISAAVIVFLINYYATSLVSDQTARNQRLKDEITKFENQIKDISGIKKMRQALVARMKMVQNLQASRALTVRLFDEIIKIMPDGAYLTHIGRVGDKVTLKGHAESNTNISQIMRNIESSSWIQNPELTEIKKATESQSTTATPSTSEAIKNDENEFNLSFILKPKNLSGGKHNEHQLK